MQRTERTAHGTTRAAPVLRLLVAVPLGVSAYLHFDIAQEPLASGGRLTLAGLFIAQAVIATLVGLWVLALGDRVAVAAGGVVALGSLVALVASVYVRIPAIGPFPVLYEPLWYGEKVVAAVAAAIATAAAFFTLARMRKAGSR